MEIFIDSADLKELEAAAKTGLIDGVTTNPSLVSKTGMKFEELIAQICELVSGPVSAEVTGVTREAIVREGRALSRIHPNVVVKIPLISEGISACRDLSREGIKTNVTLCFNPIQAMMAAKAGATYISPFVGRLDDIGQKGMDLISDIVEIYQTYGFQTKVLAASIRHNEHVLEAIKAGAHVATIPFKVFQSLLKHPLTDSGLAQFMKDWESMRVIAKN